MFLLSHAAFGELSGHFLSIASVQILSSHEHVNHVYPSQLHSSGEPVFLVRGVFFYTRPHFKFLGYILDAQEVGISKPVIPFAKDLQRVRKLLGGIKVNSIGWPPTLVNY